MPFPPPRTKRQYQLWKAENDQRYKEWCFAVYRLVEAERLLEPLDAAIARVAKRFDVTEAAVSYRYEQALKELSVSAPTT